ncbi:MAG: beta-propeller domain-containing protein, partial [Candidatus Diapherotrites archaeon]
MAEKTGEKQNRNFMVIVALVGLLAVAMVLAIAWLNSVPQPEAVPSNLQRFNSYSDLAAYFESARTSNRYYGGGDILSSFVLGSVQYSATSKMASESSGASGGSPDYSKTNIQVEGVDEADIIKTDGKYAYALAGNKLYIIEAYPAESAKTVSETAFESGTPRELFISGDRLLVFSDSYGGYKCAGGPANGQPEKCFGYSGGTVSARLYDIADREKPVLEKEIEFEGSYLTSRLIGNNAYFVVNSYPGYNYGEKDDNTDIIPQMRTGGSNGTVSRVAEPEKIGYVPNVMPQSFVTIVSLNLESEEMQKEVLAASGDSVYASQENLYITAPVWYKAEESIPLQAARSIGGGIIFPMPSYSEKTSISKFSLDNGKISFEAEGIVPGHIINQFSMDEFEEHFRIATTIGQVSRGGSGSTNNVYVLDKGMKLAGKVE